ncbi:hypothetical protein [Candidatus Nanohalovita haloferacivicina]|uniref:hypothetical protein n=1 Tax=Candidatus Nanohalovita haloferacivicina TaxID=2978046 RepID=UPI00325FA7AC|nr:hypothetical protein HBNXNv_0025 [Candidatus Nanohalobia archaeon BNXNv]
MTQQLDTTADILQEGPEILRTKASEGRRYQDWMDEDEFGNISGNDPHNGNKITFSEGRDGQPGSMRETPQNTLYRSADCVDILYTADDPEDTALFYIAMENEMDNNDASRAVDWNEPTTMDEGGIRGLLGGDKPVHWARFTGSEEIEESAKTVMNQYSVPETGEVPDVLRENVQGGELERQDEGYWQSNSRYDI